MTNTLQKLLDGVNVEWVSLGDEEFFRIENRARKAVKASLRVHGNTPYYGANNIQGYVKGYTHDGDYVLVGRNESASLERYSIQYATGKFWANDHLHVVGCTLYVNPRFLYHYLCTLNFIYFLTGGDRPKLNQAKLLKIPIPIPPIEIQNQIVNILDKFDTITNSTSEGLLYEIELRKKQYEYLLQFLKIS